MRLATAGIDDDSVVGASVGTLSVVNGSGTYTYSITADPDSKFVLDGVDTSLLELEATVRYYLGSAHSVTISATNGVDPPVVRTFSVPVNAVVAPSFTSNPNQTLADDTAFALDLNTDEPCTFTFVGNGADSALFNLADDDLSSGSLDYEVPLDADFNNVYQLGDVIATSIATGLTTTLAHTVTVLPGDINGLLMEDGSYLLLENSDNILLEAA